MSPTQIFSSNSIDFPQNEDFLNRTRLQKIINKAMSYPVIAVCAGSGYGKTQTISSFLKGYDACTTWIQLSDRDNLETRFWESVTHIISMNWPDVGASLVKIGFPRTDEAFEKFRQHWSKTFSTVKRVMVYDDFHLIHNPSVQHFFERVANAMPSNGCVIIISRTMPEINVARMMMRDRIYTINEDMLCFTEDEISQYFKQLTIPIARQNIRDIYEDTRGWACAINLVGRSLRKVAKYERYVLDAMKTNIFKLMEMDISNTISESLWRFLLRISLIDHLSVSLVKALTMDDITLVEEMEQLNAYIRYDFNLGAYVIHHLFLDYLRQESHILTDEERRATYQIAGEWSENNDYQMDALSYFEKSGDYDAVMRIVYSFSMQMSQDIASYMLEIFNRIPLDVAAKNPLFPAMNLKLKISLGLIDESSALAEQYAGEYEARPESDDKNRALAEIYGIWAVLRMIMCPYTDVYDFDAYYEKARLYYDKKPYKACCPLANQLVGAYALHVGTNRSGAPDDFIAAMTRAIPHASHVLNGSFYGFDDLARGELFFYQRELDHAEQYLRQALDKSRSRRQYDIQARSLIYLMLVYLTNSDIKTANAMLQSIEALLDEKDYANRYETCDVARAHFYLALGLPEQIPDWLKADFSSYVHPVFFQNYINRVKAQYRYLTQRYNELLAFLKNEWKSQRLLIGKTVFKILEALTLYQLKQKEEAIFALSEAHNFAASNNLIIPFTQYSKDMRTLTAAALKDEKCTIPKPWLENINRKSSAYSKRRAYMISEYRAINNLDDETALTKREIAVIKDLSQGLSRSEIAVSQNISINTVKMVISIIYDKLHANSLSDIIRTAIERKII